MRTLIITSTVYVNSGLTIIQDSKQRLKQYLESILFYLGVELLEQIIICDNSGFEYSQYDTFFKAISSKKLEYLSFEGSKDNISKYGKGFGEGEILQYVMNNSKLIAEAGESFLKVTGRLKVLNIDNVLAKTDHTLNYFQQAGSNPLKNLKAIDTRFYQCTLEEFNKFLKNVFQQVDDNNGYFLEHLYYDTILGSKMNFKPFYVLPIISGISGSTGLIYDDGKFKHIIKYVLYNILRLKK